MKSTVFMIDSLLGHLSLIFYIFAVLDEKISWKKLLKMELLAGLPVGICWSFFHAAFENVMLSYALMGILALVFWTAAVSGIWKRGLWKSFSVVCISGALQVAVFATASPVCRNLIFGKSSSLARLAPIQTQAALFLLISLVSSILLRRMHFGRLVRYLLEDEGHTRRTAALTFLLELTLELFYITCPDINEKSLFIYVVAVIILALFLIGIVVYISRREESTRRLQMQESMILQQQMYVEHLEEMQREMRIFRHDYKNMLSGMYLHARKGEADKIQEALEKLEVDFDTKIGKKIQMAAQIGNIRIPEVKSLVLSKLTKMNEGGIMCRLEAQYPVESVGMDVWDFNRCLSILLDNAQEAALAHENPFVELLFLYGGGFLTVRVANPWDQPVDVSRIWEEGFSTKDSGRGLGLFSYRKLLAQYPDVVPVTSWDGQMFVQEFTVAVPTSFSDAYFKSYHE